jgi:hypothetical protein
MMPQITQRGRNNNNPSISLLATKENIRIMTGSESRTSCTLLFQSLEILAVSSQYILSLTRFLLHNLETCKFNITVHGINKKNILQLHKPTANLTLFQKGVYCTSI